MAANVRYRSIYYNTSGDSITRKIEILDTEAVAQVINFQSTKPDLSFEGLTVDLKPGVYPTSLKFGMYLRSVARVLDGTTYGITSGILTDIAEAAEGRFFAALYDDYGSGYELQFIGPIIYDQCVWGDDDIPLLSITAVDGMARWTSEKYVSEVGQLRYWSRTKRIPAYDNSTLIYDGPTIGVSVIVSEHSVTTLAAGLSWDVVTTWVYRETYSINSPGTGWVDQTQGRWCKAVAYDNEIITEDPGESYKLTRDIDDEKHRTVAEVFKRAILETKMTGEYSGVMYDVAMEWREHDMTTGDPTTLMRVHEDPFLDKTYNDAVIECCRLLNMRVYYARGRYHFEQISLRDATAFTRYIYNADGTSGGADETTDLDYDFGTMDIEPDTGGTFKFIAPLKKVEARVTLDSANLLEFINWGGEDYGEKYVGRVTQVAGDQKLFIFTTADITSTFDQTTLLLYPQSFINLICEHNVLCVYTIRITNINTATTYYAQAGAEVFNIPIYDLVEFTWELTPSEFTAPKIHFGGPDKRFTQTKYGHTVTRKFAAIATETLPGSTGDMYDIFISYRPIVEFTNAAGALTWGTLHVNKFWTIANTRNNILRWYSYVSNITNGTDWVEVDLNAELVYTAPNDVANSVEVKMELQWADTGQFKKSIEIYDGTNWKRSSQWSIGGIGTPVSIGELLVYEIMSLRVVPRKVYSGSFVTSLPSAENRYLRGTEYYLPLSCSVDTDSDTFQGDFIQIERTTPPDVTVIVEPDELADLAGTIGDAPPDEPIEITLYFETNETITAGATLTEVDIVNTLGAYVASGETVSIVHPTSGVTENVVLTAEILPADTVMHFESNVMANSYPDASYIVIQDGDVVIESGGSKYNYSNALYNGATHTVPIAAVDLVALTDLTGNQINKKIKVKRNGQEMLGWNPTTFAIVTPNPLFFSIDISMNQIIFATSFEFTDEVIVIDIDLNR